jgi:CIC family chloride channel protein
LAALARCLILVLRTQDMFQRIHGGNIKKWVLMGGLIGGSAACWG